jgi:hypothetical protein
VQHLTRAVVAAFVFLLACSSAFAQDYLPLRGLTAVSVDIGKLDEDAQACGVNESLLNTAASRVFVDARIEVTDSAPAAASIKVTTLRFKTMDMCVSNVRVQLVASGYGVPPYGSRSVPLTYLLASGSGMQSQSKARHGEVVTDLVKTLVDDIATRIRLANQ